MKNNSLNPHAGHASNDGETMRQRLQSRTHVLAAKAGRAPGCVSQADYEQAKREVTGESDLDRQNAVLDYRPTACPPR